MGGMHAAVSYTHLAASTLAKFANITSMDQAQFGNLGATLVDLGNNFATTEADIMNMSLRLAAAGDQVGLSEAQILGFAAALSSVGVQMCIRDRPWTARSSRRRRRAAFMCNSIWTG